MKGKQLNLIDEIDRQTSFQERRHREMEIARLDRMYKRLQRNDVLNQQIPAGRVVIMGQVLHRNGREKMHFYRTVLGYHRTVNGMEAHLVEDTNDEWPDVPPWGQVAGHENERRDIGIYYPHLYWDTGEDTEPIKTWWQIENEQWEAREREREESRKRRTEDNHRADPVCG